MHCLGGWWRQVPHIQEGGLGGQVRAFHASVRTRWAEIMKYIWTANSDMASFCTAANRQHGGTVVSNSASQHQGADFDSGLG